MRTSRSNAPGTLILLVAVLLAGCTGDPESAAVPETTTSVTSATPSATAPPSPGGPVALPDGYLEPGRYRFVVRVDCEGVTDDPTACPEFDRLVGSRIAVANAELRVPLFGTEEYGLLGAAFLPTELTGFVDGAVAWNKDESPEFDLARDSTERIPVFSAGGALRFNLFGAVVAEVYYAYPFQRPDEGWRWGFQLAPGW